ncbi:uncharacterized protein LOC114934047, partial [Nylanderia fulva]|uniref:uncharacterized protein LOC114934047 n=1 Tax=Nylanderia fulva TaxID=613905 RepID=UPI0010FB84A7
MYNSNENGTFNNRNLNLTPLERKELLVKLYSNLKESSLFGKHSVGNIREAAIKAEQMSYEKSSTRDEYLRNMNDKIMKVKMGNNLKMNNEVNSNFNTKVDKEKEVWPYKESLNGGTTSTSGYANRLNGLYGSVNNVMKNDSNLCFNAPKRNVNTTNFCVNSFSRYGKGVDKEHLFEGKLTSNKNLSKDGLFPNGMSRTNPSNDKALLFSSGYVQNSLADSFTKRRFSDVGIGPGPVSVQERRYSHVEQAYFSGDPNCSIKMKTLNNSLYLSNPTKNVYPQRILK